MSENIDLLVPIELKALMVNQQVANETVFSRWQNNYDYLIKNMESPMPDPFQSGGQNVQKGIHLHWKLPQALKHGQDNDRLFTVAANVTTIVDSLEKNLIPSDLVKVFATNNYLLSAKGVSVNPIKESAKSVWNLIDWEKGHEFFISVEVDGQGTEYLSVADAKINFPMVPNRWLVVRFQPGMDKVEPKSWVIESDYMNTNDGFISFLDPKAENLSSSGVSTRIGKSEVLTASWVESDSAGQMFLKAVGPGDVTFSAYAPSVENVFSFVDTDATTLPEGTALTYFIAGWYSNTKYDPLYNPVQQVSSAEFVARMQSLHWNLAGCDKISNYTGPVATRSLYHGMVHSLTWQTKSIPSGQNTEIPQDIASSVKVAIGNTSVEALSALVQATASEEDVDITLLEAFQYGVLDSIDSVGGRTLIADKMRQARYGARLGGILWDIVASQQDITDPPDKKMPDISEYSKKLSILNQRQRDLDDKKRALVSQQWILYARWWKNRNYNVLGLGPTNPPDDMDTIADELEENSAQYKALVASIKKLQQEISQAYSSGSIPLFTDESAINQYASKVLNLPDSLVLKPSNMPRYWHPNEPVLLVSGIANSDNEYANQALQCRTSAQVVNGLKINNTVLTADRAASLIPLPVANKNISTLIYELCKEVFFFDPVNALNIAENLFNGNVQVADVGNAIANNQWANITSYGPVAKSVASWKQPWDPIFLEWSVKWFPTYAQKDKNSPWEFKRDEWVFNGDDYDWVGTSLDDSITFGYSGRTILSSNTVLNFENRLRDYINKSKQPDPKLEKLDDLLKVIKSWGILSQRLSGIHEQFVTRSIEQAWPPIGDVAALVQNQFQSSPDPSKGDKDYDYGPVSPSFFPQMGGFFVLDNIQIVDSFGQCISLLPANNNPTGGNVSAFTPVRSKQVTPANSNISLCDYTPAQFVKQSLGLVQPAQLKMRWGDAIDDTKEIGLAADANPVCGWILPNHLDKALSIYDQSGQLLGEIQEDLNTGDITWYPAPDSQTPINNPNNITNPHLRGVVTGLFAAEKQSKTAIENFTKVIDETLWLIDPLGGRADKNMSVLVGRPLAVLRIKLGLELEGNPYYNQSWRDTFEQNDNGVTKTPFDLKLGSLVLREDGLLGYYSNSNYQTFNSVHYPEGIDAASGYVKQIGGKASNYLSLLPNASDTFVTLIMDPRGSLHGSTGILPVKDIVLPDCFVDSALKNMEVIFRVGSLLTSTQAIQIPRLSEQHGKWSWINHTSVTDYESENIEFTSQKAKLSTPSVEIKDGWLKLIANHKGDK